MLASLPTGKCTCPHWGYVVKGSVIVRYDDYEEVLKAGDAFYMPPGHAPEAEEGTELIQFSPTDQLAEVDAALAKAMGG
jgi:quercetin dioxygenase-like cupin family protein